MKFFCGYRDWVLRYGGRVSDEVVCKDVGGGKWQMNEKIRDK